MTPILRHQIAILSYSARLSQLASIILPLQLLIWPYRGFIIEINTAIFFGVFAFCMRLICSLELLGSRGQCKFTRCTLRLSVGLWGYGLIYVDLGWLARFNCSLVWFIHFHDPDLRIVRDMTLSVILYRHSWAVTLQLLIVNWLLWAHDEGCTLRRSIDCLEDLHVLKSFLVDENLFWGDIYDIFILEVLI